MTPRWHKILQKLLASTRVESGPLPTPCWVWTGPDDGEQGYGRMSLDGHTVKVHRVGYMQFNGYLPPKKHVDHLCRNRRCWNPEHLEAVTHKQNQKRRRKSVLNLSEATYGGVIDLREGNTPIHEIHGSEFSLILTDDLKDFTKIKDNPPLEYRCEHCPDKDKPGMCIAGVKCQGALYASQCSCERLGVTPGVRGRRRCPGCPKALPETPEWRQEEPRPCADTLRAPERRLPAAEGLERGEEEPGETVPKRAKTPRGDPPRSESQRFPVSNISTETESAVGTEGCTKVAVSVDS